MKGKNILLAQNRGPEFSLGSFWEDAANIDVPVSFDSVGFPEHLSYAGNQWNGWKKAQDQRVGTKGILGLFVRRSWQSCQDYKLFTGLLQQLDCFAETRLGSGPFVRCYQSIWQLGPDVLQVCILLNLLCSSRWPHRIS